MFSGQIFDNYQTLFVGHLLILDLDVWTYIGYTNACVCISSKEDIITFDMGLHSGFSKN